MARSLQRLSALTVDRAKAPGYLHDGGGLYLQVTSAGRKSWIFRYSLAGRRPEMGLGPYPEISLAAARTAAAGARSLVKAGKDPIRERDAEIERQRLERARGVTWGEALPQFLAAHEGTWRNAKHRQQWRNTLDTYASPILGRLKMSAIDTAEVTKVLDPIWHTLPETASRVRGRIERVWDWAKVKGYCAGENPARWRGHLDKVYPAPGKVRKVKHHAAVAIDALPATYGRLTQSDGMAALALRFVILTAARAGEVTGAKWPEIDLEGKIWTVPPERMKARREHRVPLSSEAVAILTQQRECMHGDYVFPGWRDGRPLSIASLTKALKTAGRGSATVHGFRSTFKDWASERTETPNEVTEMALAHVIEDKVEAAYRRGELMTKRALLMGRWATFATSGRATATSLEGSVVVPIRGAA